MDTSPDNKTKTSAASSSAFNVEETKAEAGAAAATAATTTTPTPDMNRLLASATHASIKNAFKWIPDKENPKSAGRLVCPRRNLSLAYAIAYHVELAAIKRGRLPNTVKWATMRDPNPVELANAELLCASAPASGIHPCTLIADACDLLLEQVEQLLVCHRDDDTFNTKMTTTAAKEPMSTV